MSHVGYFIAGWIFLIGLYGAVTSRNLIHLCVCLGVIQSSTYVLLVTIGYRTGAPAPVFNEGHSGPAVDSVVQALMLTDIVVEATVIALLLALAIQIHKKTGTLDPNQVKPLRG